MNKIVKTILLTAVLLLITIAISVVPLLCWAVQQPKTTESSTVMIQTEL